MKSVPPSVPFVATVVFSSLVLSACDLEDVEGEEPQPEESTIPSMEEVTPLGSDEGANQQLDELINPGMEQVTSVLPEVATAPSPGRSFWDVTFARRGEAAAQDQQPVQQVAHDDIAAPLGSSSNGYCELDHDTLRMLEHVNEARQTSSQCGGEQYPAVQPVTWSCELEDVAHSHSSDMAQNNFFSHTGSNGLQFRDRVSAQGYDWSSLGENLAAGFNRTTVSEVVKRWMDSPAHCVKMMNGAHSEMGLAVATSEHAVYHSYWTLILANPK